MDPSPQNSNKRKSDTAIHNPKASKRRRISGITHNNNNNAYDSNSLPPTFKDQSQTEPNLSDILCQINGFQLNQVEKAILNGASSSLQNILKWNSRPQRSIAMKAKVQKQTETQERKIQKLSASIPIEIHEPVISILCDSLSSMDLQSNLNVINNNMMELQSSPPTIFDPRHKMLFLDFDDTLFPSTLYLEMRKRKQAPGIHAIDREIKSLLQYAIFNHWDLYILSNGSDQWFQDIKDEYPSMSLLQEHGIRFISARKCETGFGFADRSVDWKVNAFKQVLERRWNPLIHLMIKPVIISMGDGPQEFIAIAKALNDLDIDACTIRIKSKRNPSLQTMAWQLQWLRNNLGAFAEYNSSTDISLQSEMIKLETPDAFHPLLIQCLPSKGTSLLTFQAQFAENTTIKYNEKLWKVQYNDKEKAVVRITSGDSDEKCVELNVADDDQTKAIEITKAHHCYLHVMRSLYYHHCDICGKSFATAAKVKQHKSEMHGPLKLQGLASNSDLDSD